MEPSLRAQQKMRHLLHFSRILPKKTLKVPIKRINLQFIAYCSCVYSTVQPKIQRICLQVTRASQMKSKIRFKIHYDKPISDVMTIRPCER